MAEQPDFELEQMMLDIDPSFEGDKEAFARELLEKKKWEQANPRIQAHVARSRMEAGSTLASSVVTFPENGEPVENEAPAPEMQQPKRGRVRKNEANVVDREDRTDQVSKVEGFDH